MTRTIVRQPFPYILWLLYTCVIRLALSLKLQICNFSSPATNKIAILSISCKVFEPVRILI